MTKNDLDYKKSQPETIQEMFNSIAQDYDRTNGVLSLRLHQKWNKKLIQKIVDDFKPQVLLDLCCGTGEIGLGWLAEQSEAKSLYLLDFSSKMLDIAKEKGEKANRLHQISYLQADAQEIPLGDESVNSVVVSYGIRNVQNPQKCFNAVCRVLTKGGYFGILELTQPKNRLLRECHGFYLKYVLPFVGGILTKNPKAYQYLSTSIPSFIEPQEIQSLLSSTGFEVISSDSLYGGIATLMIAKKS